MKVLLTGAFGNLGVSTLELLLPAGRHDVLCCDLRTRKNQRKCHQLSKLGAFDTVWADVRDPSFAGRVVQGRDCILHLAGIIPPQSELDAELVQRVNVEGTHHMITAAQKLERQPKFVFTSSITVHGNQYSSPPPRHSGEQPEPMDNYTRSKVHSENELIASGLPWTILRIGAAMPLDLLDRDMQSSLSTMFGVPLDQRIEVVHPRDVAIALANTIDADTDGKILYIGGGESCQMLYRQFMKGLFETLGVGTLPDRAFRIASGPDDYWHTDYMDTYEAEQLLHFQHNSFADYLDEMKKTVGWRRPVIRLFRPIARRVVLWCSPYAKAPVKVR